MTARSHYGKVCRGGGLPLSERHQPTWRCVTSMHALETAVSVAADAMLAMHDVVSRTLSRTGMPLVQGGSLGLSHRPRLWSRRNREQSPRRHVPSVHCSQRSCAPLLTELVGAAAELVAALRSRRRIATPQPCCQDDDSAGSMACSARCVGGGLYAAATGPAGVSWQGILTGGERNS